MNNTHAGEIINSMRLSEARSLLSRYEKKKSNNGEAVAAGSGAGAVAAADVEKDLPPAEVEMAGGVAADKEAAVGGGGAGDVHGVEQRLMRLTETAVMALTQVWCMVYSVWIFACFKFLFCVLDPSSCVNQAKTISSIMLGYRLHQTIRTACQLEDLGCCVVPPNEVRTLAMRV